MSYAIKVTNLGKQYTIGASQGRYKSLRDSLTQTATAPFRRLLARKKDEKEDRTIWALKDVSFEIAPGEVVGIIGRNGAGKSTLLKLLARITEPTTGEIRMRGRVGSLLEVGTGFHPELTGRENIFLNGAILGMSRKEIERKFDEIVDFAEVKRFIDTPAKHLSSGMYMRLAFAVAAHLEPEILLVDEVLAVGDAQFQKKCLGKMGEVAKEGRTVLFVSHNMAAVSKLCNKGICLKAGEINHLGYIDETISHYTSDFHKSALSINNCGRRAGSGGIRFYDIDITDNENTSKTKITSDESILLSLSAKVDAKYQNKTDVVIGFGIDTEEGTRILTCVSSWIGKYATTIGPFLNVLFKIPYIPLLPGKYLISISVSYSGDTLDYVEHCKEFELIYSEKQSEFSRDITHGFINIPYDFDTVHVQ